MRRLRNILIVIGIVILILVVAGAGYVTTTIRRPLPQTDGTLSFVGLDGSVEIYRDSLGVPQIYATTTRDLFFAQGVVHAQDRWWQMEFNRHTGMGRISELVGMKEAALRSDKFIRTVGWNRAAQADVDALAPETRAVLDAYSSGVNAYTSGKSGADLAVEYSILGLTGVSVPIEPWQPVHSTAWAKVMAWGLSGNLDYELERTQLYQKLGADGPQMIDNYFAPPYPFGAHPTILVPTDLSPLPTIVQNSAPTRPLADELTTDLSRVQTQLVGNVERSFAPIIGKGAGIGSNNWVIGGSRTQSGKPLLANDPHLAIQQPSIWYEVGLHCIQLSEKCPYDVEGFSFPGTPGVIIGHNQRIAWGVTNVGPDTQDLYIIKVDPKDDTKYEVDGKTEAMNIITETIRFGDNTPPLALRVRVTRFGPIITDTPSFAKEYDKPLALRWTAISEKSDLLGAFLGIDRATDWKSFRQALSGFVTPAQNFVYADVDGNIGYQTPGLMPIRAKGHSGLLPIDGSTTRYDWKGYIPFEYLPHTFNPARGYIASANEALVPPEYYTQLAQALGDHFGQDSNYTISTEWDYGYRAQRIENLIKATDKHSVDSIKAIQGDDFNGSAAEILPYLFKLDFGSDVPKDVIDWMKAWDEQSTMNSGQAALYSAFWVQLSAKLWKDQVGFTPSGSNIAWGTRLLLDQPDNIWWDDMTTSGKKEMRDDILRSAFVDAYKGLVTQLGSDTKAWKWGTLHTAKFVSAPLGQSGIGLIENFVNNGPVAVSGSTVAVNATSWDSETPYGTNSIPSMRMIIDLSDLNNSQWIQSTGQSGHPTSAHYHDMTDLWRTIQYDPMRWDAATIQKAAVSKLVLQPQ